MVAEINFPMNLDKSAAQYVSDVSVDDVLRPGAPAAGALSGRRRAGLRGIFAEVRDQAVRAVWLAGLAHVTPVQDQPVMRILAKAWWRVSLERVLDGERRLPRREPGPVADAENMRIHGNRGLAEGRVEHDVGGFPANAR